LDKYSHLFIVIIFRTKIINKYIDYIKTKIKYFLIKKYFINNDYILEKLQNLIIKLI
jgi:hypothetical protein